MNENETLPPSLCDVLVVGGGPAGIGAAGALATRTGCAPRDLDPEEIKAGVRARGCIVP